MPQPAHGAHTLAELLEKIGFGVRHLGQCASCGFGCGESVDLGNIMPMRIDSKRVLVALYEL